NSSFNIGNCIYLVAVFSNFCIYYVDLKSGYFVCYSFSFLFAICFLVSNSSFNKWVKRLSRFSIFCLCILVAVVIVLDAFVFDLVAGPSFRKGHVSSYFFIQQLF